MPGSFRKHDAIRSCDETWKAEGEVGEPAIGARRRTKHETHRAVKSLWELCRTAQWCDAADAGRIAAALSNWQAFVYHDRRLWCQKFGPAYASGGLRIALEE